MKATAMISCIYFDRRGDRPNRDFCGESTIYKWCGVTYRILRLSLLLVNKDKWDFIIRRSAKCLTLHRVVCYSFYSVV